VLLAMSPVAVRALDDELPSTLSVAVPESASGTVAGALGTKPTCSTTAIPPQEIDVLDPASVTARTELSCGDAAYASVLSAQFKYYGDDPAGPMGSGALLDAPTVVTGNSPLTAVTKISKLSARPGWYRTVGASTVTYPYRLDTHQSPGQGCAYSSSTSIVCRVASSYVHVETAQWILKLIPPLT
jgi:hypothetical protein